MSAAQEFLDKQLAKNKYTIKQQERLDASGGASVVGSGEGIVPGGEAYAKYGKMPNTTGTSDSSTTSNSSTSSAGGGDKYRGFGEDSDSGRNYASGAWGSGDLDAKALAAKYKLDTSKEGRGDGHIWGRNADGSEVYIGKASMDLASNKDLIAAHSGQANSEEDDHSSLDENLSSAGDIKGAILTEWAGGNAGPKEEEPERTPIEHSPEVQQAHERVRNYENNTLSGKTSDEIFNETDFDGNQTSIGSKNHSDNIDSINEKYSPKLQFNTDFGNSFSPYADASNYGQAGIGTPNDSSQKSAEATSSFLNAKKTDVKKAYNFKPTYSSSIKYGAD